MPGYWFSQQENKIKGQRAGGGCTVRTLAGGMDVGVSGDAGVVEQSSLLDHELVVPVRVVTGADLDWLHRLEEGCSSPQKEGQHGHDNRKK